MASVIIRTPNHLGDCLMALPAIRALAEAGSGFEMHLLTPQWADPIYRSIPRVEIHLMDRHQLHGALAVRRQVRHLQRRNYDTGILLTPSFSSALALYLSGIKERIGHVGNSRGWLLNRVLPESGKTPVHRSEQYRKIMELYCGYLLPLSSSQIAVAPEKITETILMLGKTGIGAARPLIAIAPQAVAESRRWGVSNYGALAEMLLHHFGGVIILLGTAAEKDAGNIISLRHKGIINLCGKTDIETAAACLAQFDLFIGNDSGLAHLAAAVDIPLVILSGADNPSETSPLSNRKTIIIKDHLDCISCVKNVCPKRDVNFMRCMRDITVRDVFLAASRYLEPSRP